MANSNFCLFAANRKTETANICLLQQKQNTEVCFPWSANNKSQMTVAVSANVPIYAPYILVVLAQQ
jgi:hypothetical protein